MSLLLRLFRGFFFWCDVIRSNFVCSPYRKQYETTTTKKKLYFPVVVSIVVFIVVVIVVVCTSEPVLIPFRSYLLVDYSSAVVCVSF